jgi:Lon protease-like protein
VEIGLFLLPMVLLPGERVPLHVFEERYKELVGECLRRGGEFGVVLADEAGMRTAGTTAQVVEVLRRLPDGRMDVVVEGRTRFRVVQLTAGRSFVTAEVEELSDEEGAEEPGREEVAACLRAYRGLVEAMEEDMEVDLTAESLAFEIGGRVGFADPLKQELLEMRSERARVRRLTELLVQARDVVRRQRRARELAEGDGHVSDPEG